MQGRSICRTDRVAPLGVTAPDPSTASPAGVGIIASSSKTPSDAEAMLYLTAAALSVGGRAGSLLDQLLAWSDAALGAC